jgi:hypothetical protein
MFTLLLWIKFDGFSQNFSLGVNQITDTGAKVIAETLVGNTTLKELMHVLFII